MAFNQSANSSMTMAADSQSSNTFSADTTRLNLPPPQIFDILPALHELLARIERAPGPESTDPSLQSSTSTPFNESEDIGAHYQDQPPLEPKDLPTEVLAIKSKIRKALKEIEKLPDMEWSVEEQEEEIRELEERIARQKAMLGKFGEMAKGTGLG